MDNEELLHLPPLPPHVLMPTRRQLDFVDRLGIDAPPIIWTKKDCDTCKGAQVFTTWTGETGDLTKTAQFACPCQEQLRLYRYFAYHGLKNPQTKWRLLDIGGWLPNDPRRVWLVEWMNLALTQPDRLGSVGAMLTGVKGNTGKSLSMVLLAKSMMLNGMDIQFLSASSLSNEQIHWTKMDDVRPWWTKRVRGAPVLFVESLGDERGNDDYTRNRIFDLVSHRSSSRLLTFIETSLSVEQIESRYGKDTAAVMVDLCPPVSFDMADPYPMTEIRNEARLGIRRPAVFLAAS